MHAPPTLEPGPRPPYPGIVEPVARTVEQLLRQAVLEHTTGERRRVFPATVHVGVPGQVTAALELGQQLGELRLDHALRADAVEAMVRRVRRPGPTPLVWLTRRGALELQDADLAWLAAARTAGAELGTAVLMVVVNRTGWRDPATGVGRTWRRLRAPEPGRRAR